MAQLVHVEKLVYRANVGLKGVFLAVMQARSASTASAIRFLLAVIKQRVSVMVLVSSYSLTQTIVGSATTVVCLVEPVSKESASRSLFVQKAKPCVAVFVST